MKIGQIIVLHLYKYKQVTLQGIGTFRLAPSLSLSTDINSAATVSDTAVTFEYNPKAAEDASLIDTIIFHTKKLKSLAAADLDSFLLWQKQLLNMNMAFNLEDVGVLQKDKQGTLGFIPSKKPDLKVNTPKSGRTATETKPILHKYSHIKIKYGKKLLPVAVLVIFGTGIITWGVNEFVKSYKAGKEISADKMPIVANNTKILSAGKDTFKHDQPALTSNVKNLNSAYVFKVVFLKTGVKQEAVKTLNEIYGYGHSANMYSTDSGYKIAMPFNRPLSDTSQIKDSLNKYNSLGNGAVEIE